ncbi:MAG: 3-oxoacyl-[acyl-carrier protein] reductase [Myxococcaceae bacterium]|nr:3-oxoacyl-[acyl-carrier protein] reductase [Myxococcaceae bacterium]
MSRALVTGASRGIGAAIAKALAKAGHLVIINYRSQRAEAEAVLTQIEADGGRAVLAPFDVRDREHVNATLDELLKDPDPIDVLVNNAGIARDNAFPSTSWEDWEAVTRTSLDGFYNVTRPLVMPMVRRKYGRIITISSVSGVTGNRGQTNYAAAKAGLIGATKSLSKELAKRRITVNAVAPGLIDTEMTKDAPVQEIVKLIPAARFGRAEEVADLVMFLASERAAYITGQCIGINGGLA